MKEIELTKGKVALVDDEDYEYLIRFKWHYGCGYAICGYKGKTIRMHRVIIKYLVK